MCRYGVSEPYEKLKAATRGRAVTKESIHQLLTSLQGELPQEAISALESLTPAAYVGNAAQQAHDLSQYLNREML